MKTDFLAFLCLVLCFVSANASSGFQEQAVLAANEEERVLFNFIIARSGAHTQSVLYTEDEFDMYQLPRDDLFNKISVIGLSQAWSLGNHIRQTWPQLYKDISADSVRAFYMNIEKSELTVDYFLMGLYGKSPNWQETDFLDEKVWENIKEGGNCYGCPTSSIMDLGMIFSQNFLQEDIEMAIAEENMDQLTVHSVNACPKLLSNYHAPAVLGAVNDNFFYNIHLDQIGDFYDYVETLYTEEEKSIIVNVRLLTFLVWESHRVHMLPEVDKIPEFLRKILTIENFASSERHHFLNIVYLQEEYVKVTSSRMLEKVKNSFIGALSEENELKTILYAVHDNNLASFLISLLGREQLELDWISNRPAYSSSIQLVLKSGSNGYFVNVLVNHQTKTIEGCSEDCPIDQFIEKLNGMIIPDLVAYCKDYPNEDDETEEEE